jgi:peroxiredoxin Q/BCP
MEKIVVLEPGDQAPQLGIPDEIGNIVKIEDFKGEWLVLYFYPKDDTPGCTEEAKCFTRILPDFSQLRTKVVGISADSVESHQNFKDKYNIKFPLLSDTDNQVIKRYGVSRSNIKYGKEIEGINRSTFLIDPKGVIRQIWKDVNVEGHADQVKNELENLSLKHV